MDINYVNDILGNIIYDLYLQAQQSSKVIRQSDQYKLHKLEFYLPSLALFRNSLSFEGWYFRNFLVLIIK